MAQETSHTSPGFGKNTNGLGIAIIAVVLVVFALVGWNFWHEGTAEQNWYRFENTGSSHGHEGHQGHGAGHGAAAPAAAADSTATTTDSAAAKPAHDSTSAAH